jgi:hypothetical protein
MTRLFTVGLLGSGLVLATGVSAQICDGSASFGRAPVQLTARGGFNSDGHVFGGGLAAGGAGTFAGVGVGKTTYELGGASTEVNVEGGYQIALTPKHTSEICPLVGWSHSSGPHDFEAFGNGVLYDLDRTGFALGAGIGGMLPLSTHVAFLPSVSLSMLTVKSKTTNQNLGRTTNTSETASLFDLGFAFLFNDAFLARPSIVFLQGVDDKTTTFGLDLTVSLGHKGSH